jgi:hypothetical protein
MERPEDFEERTPTSDPETYGTDTPATGEGDTATPEERRDEAGRYSGTETPQATSDAEEKRTDA